MLAQRIRNSAAHRSTTESLRCNRRLCYGTRRFASKLETRSSMAASAGPSDVFVLDFDGVLVDSEPEVCTLPPLAAVWRHMRVGPWQEVSPSTPANHHDLCQYICGPSAELAANMYLLAQVSKSAYDAARDYWPAVFQAATEQQVAQLMSGMRQTRPVLVRGYESMVMARLLLEDPSAVQPILKDWPNLLPATLAR